MPFTFSHPAIVLPLLNKRLKIFSSTGLIIGSIIPDFESFVRFDEHKLYSHTWSGIFWFDLPLAIIASFIFHDIVRDPLYKNLPNFLEKKASGYLNFQWNAYFRKHYLMIVVSMLIGISLHLLWDAFTHLNLASPDATDSTRQIHGMLLFKMLQDSNSILGLIIVAWYVYALPDTTAVIEEEPREKMKFYIDAEKPKKYLKLQYWVMVFIITSITAIAAMHVIGKVPVVLFIDIVISGSMLPWRAIWSSM